MSQFGFSKKQIKFLEGLILINAMALSLVIPSSTSSGEIPTVLPQNNCAGTPVVPYGRTECGSASCTVVATTNACSSTITFPVPFSTAPVPNTGWINVVVSSVPSGSVPVTIPQSYTTWTFFSTESLGQQWINKPARTTEIFGDTSHRLIADWSNQTSANLVVNCVTQPSIVADNSTWTVQYSNDFTVTWNNITQLTVATGQQNGTQGNCDVASISDSCMFNNVNPDMIGCYFPIPAGARQVVYLRLVGQLGQGTGDNQSFQSAYIVTHTSSSITTNSRIFSMKLQNLVAPSTTSFQPLCTASIAVTLSTVCNFKWTAFSSTG